MFVSFLRHRVVLAACLLAFSLVLAACSEKAAPPAPAPVAAPASVETAPAETEATEAAPEAAPEEAAAAEEAGDAETEAAEAGEEAAPAGDEDPGPPAEGADEPAASPAAEAPATASVSTEEVEAIYKRSCGTCHSIAATGAPVTGDAAAWAPRIEKGRDVLLEHSIKGFNAMPPLGLCMDCTEDQFLALIRYMSGSSLDD